MEVSVPPDSHGAGGRTSEELPVGGESGFGVSTSSERACALVQLDGLFAHHPQAPPSGQPVGGRVRGTADDTVLVSGGSKEPHGHIGVRPTELTGGVARSAPNPRNPEEFEPGTVRETLFSRLPDQEQALIRSQAGPGAGSALTAVPTGSETMIPSHLFRIVLLRRLRQPLPLSERSCRCGRLLDVCGHHHAVCARAGMLGRQGFSLESIAGRICKEAKGRVRTNMFVRDMDLAVPGVPESRRLEVVVDGLPLRGGAQLALDTALMCALHADGASRRHGRREGS